MKTFNCLILITLMCFQSQMGNGQTLEQGSVLYEVVPKPISARTLSKVNTAQYTEDFSKAHKMYFELKFNNNQALYEKLGMDDLKAKMVVDKSTGTSREVKTFGAYQRKTFTDLTNETVLNYLRDGRAIEYPINNEEWVITNETKTIKGFVCYKALKEKLVTYTTNSSINGKHKRQVKSYTTVWFTKEIPNKFGPSIYGGFSGLVLEVESNLFTITAKEVNLDIDNLNIIQPKATSIITSTEYKSNNLKNKALN